jgi:hypothetical protein
MIMRSRTVSSRYSQSSEPPADVRLELGQKRAEGLTGKISGFRMCRKHIDS